MEDENSVIPRLTPVMYDKLRQEGRIYAGMIPKLEYSFVAIHAGVQSVRLVHPDELDNPEAGTRITGEE